MASYLQWPDYLILSAFLVISLGIGLYHSLTGGRQKTTAEFIMANRRLGVLPTAISLLVTFQSAITLLGFAAEMYLFGIQFFVFIVITPTLSLLIVERIMVPWLYPLKLVSAFEYLERRFFSKSVRIFGASMGIISAILYMGVSIFAPSAALESATGLPLSVSIPVMASVAVAYTALGGMRAVIWTDVFQFLVMIAGYTAIFVKGLMVIGGISKVFELAGQEGRLIWADWNPDPRVRHTVWGLFIGHTFAMTSAYGLAQNSVQRYSAVNNLAKARATLLINIPPMVIMNALACIMGLIVLAYYAAIQCDPLANKEVSNPNQLLSFFVIKIFMDSPGLSGLFLSTLYGGSLSSISSSLSGSAANIWEDILQWKLSKLPESKKALINRLLVVILGAMSAGIAFFSATIPGPIVQVLSSLCSAVVGPLFGIYFLGGISKHANWKGTLFGGFVGLAFCMWLSVGSLTIRTHQILPPVSTKGCPAKNFTLIPGENYTSSEAINEFQYFQSSLIPENSTTQSSVRHKKMTLHGLQNFYAISYVWFFLLGVIVTFIVGMIASLIMRDRELEKLVDDSLLLRFKDVCKPACECRSDEDAEINEEKDYLSDPAAKDIEKEALKNSSNGSFTKTTNNNIIKANGRFDEDGHL